MDDTIDDVININVGVLGHVDSGKTALCATISTVLSTAALDKSPQSQEKGITMDLQFSALRLIDDVGKRNLNVTLVDCPGHASLIRTIMGGANIIDAVLMVIDVTKGIQTQTAECLIIAEITCEHILFLLNKVDLIPEAQRADKLDKLQKGLSKAFADSKFAKPLIFIPFSTKSEPPIGVSQLHSELQKLPTPIRAKTEAPLIFNVDHCFAMKGKGTIVTGTVQQGQIALNQSVCLPHLGQQYKVKSIQMFKKSRQKAVEGDRVGCLLQGLDPDAMERGLICSPPNTIRTVDYLIATFNKVKYFRQAIESNAKFHLTVGHATVMAKATFFFGEPNQTEWDPKQEYLFAPSPCLESDQKLGPTWVLLTLEKPILLYDQAYYIASKLDVPQDTKSCRIAFHGQVIEICEKPTLKLFKYKTKQGEVERVADAQTLIGTKLFKKETDISKFVNMKVECGALEGYIEGSFGASGKFKARFPSAQFEKNQSFTDPIVLTLKRYLKL